MIFTTAAKKSDKPHKMKLWAVALWLAVWQLGSMALGQEILLVSPLAVLIRLASLILTGGFWKAILFSLMRIALGFFGAMAAGILLAGLSARFRRIQELAAPVMLAIKAVPVASFVILVLVWVPSRNLSVIISFLMVLPVIYTNVLNGIRETASDLLEMAQVFSLPAVRVIRYIYISQVMPYFRSACMVALGLCWKAGVAAEVIGIPKGSIGEKLYNAKIYLNTPDLFAWTLVIVLVSQGFERVFLALLDVGVRRLERI